MFIQFSGPQKDHLYFRVFLPLYLFSGKLRLSLTNLSFIATLILCELFLSCLDDGWLAGRVMALGFSSVQNSVKHVPTAWPEVVATFLEWFLYLPTLWVRGQCLWGKENSMINKFSDSGTNFCTVVSYQNESFSSKWELPCLSPSSLELWRKERARRQLSFWWKTLILIGHYGITCLSYLHPP